MSRSSLTLYTPDNNARPVHAELIELLSSLKLTGESLGSFEFLAGRHFFSHITFLGCAPNIPTSHAQGPNIVRITVPPLAKPELFAGLNAPAPLCPDCKQPLQEWKHLIKHNVKGQISCPRCYATASVRHLNYRKRACFSQSIIRIAPIFESEALPANGLLDTLNEALNTHFEYAFIG